MKGHFGSEWNYVRAKDLFDKSGRTRKWLADKCGIGVPYLGRLLSGKKHPSVAVLRLLAAALETTEDELLRSTDAA